MFLARVLWYLLRLALYYCQGVLRFFGKPGSRLIVPAALLALAWFGREQWHYEIAARISDADPTYRLETDVLDVVLFVSVGLLALAYYLASKLLAFILGAVPMTMRPLWPQRALRVPKERAKRITPAVVRVVVPPLPRRRA